MSYSFRDTMKKQLAREQAEVQEEVVAPEVGAEETLEPTFTADEITEMEEVKAQEAEVDSLAEGNELIDQIQDRIDANNEMIEGEAEPTEAKVVQAVGEAKHFAYLTAKIDNFITESIDFMVDNQRYALATESFSFSAKSRREQVKDVNLALEGIVQSIANGVKDLANKILEVIKGIINKIKETFSKRAKVINFANKNKANIIAMYKDVPGLINVINSMGDDDKNKIMMKVSRNRTDLTKAIMETTMLQVLLHNPKTEAEITTYEQIDILKDLKNLKSLLPLLLDVVGRTQKQLKDSLSNGTSLNEIAKNGAISVFFKFSGMKSHLLSKNLGNADLKTKQLGVDKETLDWYAKEFPAVLEAYDYTKPNLFDTFQKYSTDIVSAMTQAAAEITDNKYTTFANKFMTGLKESLATLRSINNAIYVEIETCVQVYQMYSKSKSQGENK